MKQQNSYFEFEKQQFPKKILLTLLIITMLLFTACSSQTQQQTYVCSDGSTVTDPARCPVKEQRTTGTVDVVESTPTKSVISEIKSQELSAAAKDLISKSSKATIVGFNYYRSDDPTTQDAYVVSKTKMKRTLVNKIVYSPKEQYDTIYMDLVSESAKAYCETQSSATCPDRNKAVIVDIEVYKVRTPYEWLSLIESADVTGRSKQIDGRTGKEISFTSDGKSGTMFLDSFFGLPLEVTYDGVTYEYQNSKINLNKDTELTHQQS